MGWTTNLLAVVFGYLIGSIPTAYLLVKWKANLDIRTAGSGNVGTLNSYEVTNSKFVGAVVLLVDLLKGVCAVLAAQTLGGGFPAAAAAALAAVLGHNFPVWLGFRGGRGLATAAGAMLLLGWVVLPIWMLAWFIGYKLSRDVNVGNAIATLAMLLIPWVVPVEIWREWISGSAEVFRIFLLLLALLILVRLVQPVREYFVHRPSKA
jgi:glycerol-3-phosphate acyltransferase PlsY